MKKLFVLAVVALMTTVSASAQQMFIKPMAGATLTTITGDYTDDAKMKVGLVAGAEFGYNLNEKFGFTGGLLYSMQGCAYKDIDDKSKTEYLNIPLLANYYIIPGLAVKAGVQPGILLKAKNGDVDVKDNCKKLDISIPLGVSYEFSDFVVDARYNLGLTNINDYGTAKQRNSVIMLTLGYKIPM